MVLKAEEHGTLELPDPGHLRFTSLDATATFAIDRLPALVDAQLDSDVLVGRSGRICSLFDVTIGPDGYLDSRSDRWHRVDAVTVPDEAGRAVVLTYRSDRSSCLIELQIEFAVCGPNAIRSRLWALPSRRFQEPFDIELRLPGLADVARAALEHGLQVLLPSGVSSMAGLGDATLFADLKAGPPGIPGKATAIPIGVDAGTTLPLAVWKPAHGSSLMATFTSATLGPDPGHEGPATLGETTFRTAIPASLGERLCIADVELSLFKGGWPAVFQRWSAPFRSSLDRREYDRAEQAWYRQCFVGDFLFAFDQDVRTQDSPEQPYRIDEYDARMREDFGGIDFFVFWHTFPRLGVDSRSQFELLDDLPGGRSALRRLFDAARDHGIRPFIQYIPWDTANPGEDHAQAVADAVVDIGADGVFLDTVAGVHGDFRERLDAARPQDVIMAELRPALTKEMTGYARVTGSWAQRCPTDMPAIDLVRFAVPHHKVFLVHREARSRLSQIRTAFFNAEGILLWDRNFAMPEFNGAGANAYGPEDMALVRRYRSAWTAHADAYDTDDPKPLIDTCAPHLYANRFAIEGKCAVHIFNASSEPHVGPLLEETGPARSWRYVDWFRRLELGTSADEGEGIRTVVGRVEPGEVLCVVAFRPHLNVTRHERELVVEAIPGTAPSASLHASLASGVEVPVVARESGGDRRVWGVASGPGEAGVTWLELRSNQLAIDACTVVPAEVRP